MCLYKERIVQDYVMYFVIPLNINKDIVLRTLTRFITPMAPTFNASEVHGSCYANYFRINYTY